MAKTLLYLCLCVLSLDRVWSIDGSSQTDIVLLVDSSDDVRSQNFEKEKRFLTAFVNQVFDSNVRIGLFTFGDGAYSAFTLDAYNNIRDLKQAILYLWFTTGKGNVSPAINTTLSDAFTGQLEDRECAARIMIIVTHSAIKDNALAAYFRDRLEHMRVRAIILNMAGSTAELEFVAISNSSSRVYSVSDFDELEASVSTVISKMKSDIPNTGCGILSSWGPWTSCSVTCGSGLNFRTRYCVKNEDSDKDCEGETTENKQCQLPECTDPLDGSWSMWQEWGKCSKSCENGIQQRVRRCDNPTPKNGGKRCVGKSTGSRDCADWNCPDCKKRCPPGARLSTSCEVCECSSVTLFGKLLDNRNATVNNAEIFLESRRYRPIAMSNDLGLFKASGLCMVNETIFVQAKSCESKRFTPKELNSTHWTLDNPRLDRYVLPVFTMQPSEKVRMVGQNLSLCCRAIGYPMPMSYKWFKNGIELEDSGENGTLIMQALRKSDAGKYWCHTETEAGVSLSEKVDVSIFDNSVDTCGVPKPKLQALPNGCFVTGDASKNNTVDIGNCGKALCVKSSLHDNGSCSDWWPHHCCNPKDTEVVDITCDGFNYKTTRVKSCECKLCVFKTMIFGRAIGRQNGTDVPFKLGEIIIGGEPFARTNAAGFFKFEVPKEVKRVVATFHGDYDELFEDTTKIIQAKPGGEVFVSVVIPLKPAPIAFDADNGTEVHLGASENTVPAASVEIAPNAVVTENGEPYSGPVKATFTYMDPRKKDDLEAANGDFESEGPNGETVPLVTYGMFQIGIKDNDGNSLKINKPIKYSVDASLFDVPADKLDSPDRYLWSYDRNKGIWVKLAKVKYEQAVSGSRKLLAAGRFVAEFDDPSIPEIKQTKETTERVPTGRTVRNVNDDAWVKEYEYVTRRNIEKGSCYISVSIYKNLSLSEPYDGNDIEIKTFIKDKDDKNAPYTGTTTVRLLNEGHACVPVFCNKYVELHVNRKKERLYAAEHYLPNPYYVKRTKDNEVQFESTDFGTALNCNTLPFLKPNTKCEGPMYPKLEENTAGKCNRVRYNDNSFQFKFAPFTSPPILNEVAGTGIFDKKLSWYPVSPDKATFRSCFMKVRIDIQKTYGLQVLAISRLHNINGDQFGTHIVGPVPDPRTDNQDVRCACVEFRCPGYIKDGNKEIFDRDTSIEVRLTSTNSSMKCKISKTNRRIAADVTNIQDPKKGVVGFRFTAEAGMNYGRNYGIYINDNTREEVQQVCENGMDTGPRADGLVDPKMNTAVDFDCL